MVAHSSMSRNESITYNHVISLISHFQFAFFFYFKTRPSARSLPRKSNSFSYERLRTSFFHVTLKALLACYLFYVAQIPTNQFSFLSRKKKGTSKAALFIHGLRLKQILNKHNTLNKHNMIKNPMQLAGGRPVGYLQA